MKRSELRSVSLERAGRVFFSGAVLAPVYRRVTLKVGTKVMIEDLEVELVSDQLLRLVGAVNSDAAREEFRRVLHALHQRLAAEKRPLLTVDLRELNFVNSSAVRIFVEWIQRAAHCGYRLTFRTDPKVTWHRLSFSVLKSIAPETVDVV